MGVRPTGGGAFNPDDRHVYFLAGGSADVEIASEKHPYVLVAVNEVRSPAAMERLDRIVENGAKLFLDSGIFNLTNEHKRAHPGMSMDEALGLAPEEIDGFVDLFDRYVDLVNRYGDVLWGYIELDQGGRDNKRRTRERLHDLGLSPIPVYHPFNDGWDYYDELAESYDRICFGNVVQANRHERKRLVATAWERHRRYPELWTHLLGLTPSEWLLAMPVDSADSSTWLAGVRFTHGQREVSALKAMGDLEPQFRYQIGTDAESPTGHHRARRVSAVSASMLQRQWRDHLSRLDDSLGLPVYPPLGKSEEPGMPAKGNA